MDRAHCNQRGIDDILRIEKEEATLYGLHNMKSFNKIKKKYRFFLVKPMNKTTIHVKKYGNDRTKMELYAGRNSDYIFMEDGEFII